MEGLKDDLLLHIFYILGPKEWIPMSEVCQKWTNLIDTFCWNKVKVFDNAKDYFVAEYDPSTLTMNETEKILSHCGKYLEIVALKKYDQEHDVDDYVYVKLGSDIYIISDCRFSRIIQTLSKVTANISSLLIEAIHPEFMKYIYKINTKLRKLEMIDCKFHEPTTFGRTLNNSVQSVEELILHYKNGHYPPFNAIISGFAWALPNLLKLQIKLQVEWTEIADSILNAIFKLATKLRSVDINIETEHNPDLKLTALSKLLTCGHLEEFHYKIDFDHTNLRDADVNAALHYCKKLRVLEFDGLIPTERGIKMLMSLPNLEVFSLKKLLSFNPVHYPLMPRLTTFFIRSEEINASNLIKLIKQMPALLELTIVQLRVDDDISFQAISNWISQNKVVIVNQFMEYKKLKVIKRDTDESTMQKLYFRICWPDKDYYERVIKYVQENLKDCEVVQF